jgi:apolipoprotein N-acyltransferase
LTLFFSLALTAVSHCLIFPRASISVLAWVHFIPLLFILRYEKPGRAFRLAWLAGTAASLYLYYWSFVACRMGGVNILMSVVSWVGLAAYVGLYWGLFSFFAALVPSTTAWRPFFLACLWTALEYARATFLTGFPWLLLGTSQWNEPWLIQPAAWGGVYLVSWFVFFVNAWIAQGWREVLERRWNWWRHAVPGLAAGLAWMAFSLSFAPPKLDDAAPARLSVALIQGNIDQYKKWDQAYEEDIVKTYAALTHEAVAAAPADLIIWPETSVPGWIPNEKKYGDWVAGLARQTGSPLLVGASSHQGKFDYNAAFLYLPSGGVPAQYRKTHLVPFGEVVPFQAILSKWVAVLNELGDFASAQDWTVFTVKDVNFSVNICFESLFPDLIRRFALRGAQVLINITNDGWFVDTPAAEHHFIGQVFRSVENRVWAVQTANTGISGIVDPWGRVRGRTALLEKTVLRGAIGAPAGAGPTFYTRFGDVFAFICILISVLVVVLSSSWTRIRARSGIQK